MFWSLGGQEAVMDGMVMRSVYLRPLEDGQLRQLAHELRVSKSDLIRSAISAKLREWLANEDDESVIAELELGRRGTARSNVQASGSPKAAAAKVARAFAVGASGEARIGGEGGGRAIAVATSTELPKPQRKRLARPAGKKAASAAG